MSDLSGKVIAVTGAASGIGRATALILCSRGASLALSDISADAIATFASELSMESAQKATYKTVDVANTAQVNDWFKEIIRDFGRLDGAANIAGILTSSPITDCMDEDWDKVMSINAGGTFKCLRAEINCIADGGSIVNMSSVFGLIGVPNHAVVVASKHAVIGFTRSAAKEVGQRKVRVNAVAPGCTNTPGFRSATNTTGDQRVVVNIDPVPLGRIAEPAEIARVIAWLLSDDSSYVNAEVVRIDGGWLG